MWQMSRISEYFSNSTALLAVCQPHGQSKETGMWLIMFSYVIGISGLITTLLLVFPKPLSNTAHTHMHTPINKYTQSLLLTALIFSPHAICGQVSISGVHAKQLVLFTHTLTVCVMCLFVCVCVQLKQWQQHMQEQLKAHQLEELLQLQEEQQRLLGMMNPSPQCRRGKRVSCRS